MPCPHFDVHVRTRANGESAVAGSAYQSGERLFSEYDNRTKNYLYKQRDVACAKVLLPANAPPEYESREKLWNSAEAVEKQWNAQLARRIVMALPKEIPIEQSIKMTEEYCMENFVNKGMCCDFAIHDPEPKGHNPHVHVLLTMRAIDEQGKWMPKAKKIYDLDDNGERIKLKSGRWKSHKEDTTGWNQQTNCELWRDSWEKIQNKYLEMNEREERVSLKSFEKQGIELTPTVHMGPAVCAMERKGIQTDIGNINRDVAAVNRIIKNTLKAIIDLKNSIVELADALKEAWEEEINRPEPTYLSDLLSAKVDKRKDERSSWNASARIQGTANDLHKVSDFVIELEIRGVYTLEDLTTKLDDLEFETCDIRNKIKPIDARMKEINLLNKAEIDFAETENVYAQYSKIFFNRSKEKFHEEHAEELKKHGRAKRYLDEHGFDCGTERKTLAREYRVLSAKKEKLTEELEAVRKDLKNLKAVHTFIKDVVPKELVSHEDKPSHNQQKQEKKSLIEDIRRKKEEI